MLSCPTCEKAFKKKDQLTRHINAIHYKMKYPCPNCWRVFNRKANLSRHMKKHTENMETHKDTMEKQNTEAAAQISEKKRIKR